MKVMVMRKHSAARISQVAGVLLILMAAACGANTVPTPSQPSSTPAPLVAPTVVVTLPPRPTPTLPATPTLGFNPNEQQGTWTLDLTYRLRGGLIFNDVRFIGSADLVVDVSGNVSGSIEFYTALEQPPCVVAVLSGTPITASINGIIRPEGETLVGDLQFTPTDELAITSLRVACPEKPEGQEISQPIFWGMLRSIGEDRFRVVWQNGYRATKRYELSGVMGGAWHGVAHIEQRLSR
ncbi:MAG: hypothetical protein OHK0023_28960 [Anaerolineae bacterium]